MNKFIIALAIILTGCAQPSTIKLEMAGETSGESRPNAVVTNFPVEVPQQFYPDVALKHNISARYIMLVTLNPDGHPSKAEILASEQGIKAVADDNGHVIDVSHIFDQEAVRLIMQSKWKPSAPTPAPFKMALKFVPPPR